MIFFTLKIICFTLFLRAKWTSPNHKQNILKIISRVSLKKFLNETKILNAARGKREELSTSK